MMQIPLNTVRATKFIGYKVTVDDCDYELLSKHNWSINTSDGKSFYAKAFIGGKNVAMHRYILGLNNPKVLIDHRDGNGLNNQRSNLRIATNSQNQCNKKPRGSSKYLGVNLHTQKGYKPKWRAAIAVNGKVRHIGMFKKEESAAKAYDRMAKKYHKEFANLNFK